MSSSTCCARMSTSSGTRSSSASAERALSAHSSTFQLPVVSRLTIPRKKRRIASPKLGSAIVSLHSDPLKLRGLRLRQRAADEAGPPAGGVEGVEHPVVRGAGRFDVIVVVCLAVEQSCRQDGLHVGLTQPAIEAEHLDVA